MGLLYVEAISSLFENSGGTVNVKIELCIFEKLVRICWFLVDWILENDIIRLRYFSIRKTK